MTITPNHSELRKKVETQKNIIRELEDLNEGSQRGQELLRSKVKARDNKIIHLENVIRKKDAKHADKIRKKDTYIEKQRAVIEALENMYDAMAEKLEVRLSSKELESAKDKLESQPIRLMKDLSPGLQAFLDRDFRDLLKPPFFTKFGEKVNLHDDYTDSMILGLEKLKPRPDFKGKVTPKHDVDLVFIIECIAKFNESDFHEGSPAGKVLVHPMIYNKINKELEKYCQFKSEKKVDEVYIHGAKLVASDVIKHRGRIEIISRTGFSGTCYETE